jgi:hypothetical protein
MKIYTLVVSALNFIVSEINDPMFVLVYRTCPVVVNVNIIPVLSPIYELLKFQLLFLCIPSTVYIAYLLVPANIVTDIVALNALTIAFANARLVTSAEAD